MNQEYIYIWEFKVRDDMEEAFLEAYGPEGRWAKLFMGTPGYLKTELLRDLDDPLRFVTIDRWKSHDAWRTFRSEMAVDFEALDHECEAFTLEEKQIGLFQPTRG